MFKNRIISNDISPRGDYPPRSRVGDGIISQSSNTGWNKEVGRNCCQGRKWIARITQIPWQVAKEEQKEELDGEKTPTPLSEIPTGYYYLLLRLPVIAATELHSN